MEVTTYEVGPSLLADVEASSKKGETKIKKKGE